MRSHAMNPRATTGPGSVEHLCAVRRPRRRGRSATHGSRYHSPDRPTDRRRSARLPRLPRSGRPRTWTGSTPESWCRRSAIDVEDHGGLRPGTEARLGRDYQDWYWRHEVESEREYRWLGQSLVKMPSDLFFYQELLAERRLDAVLEIGVGRGGGLWFFASVLALLGRGHVVGVDRESAGVRPPFERFPEVRVDLVHGEADTAVTVDAVRALRPDGFGLVVVDADPLPEGKIALLQRWAAAVAPGATWSWRTSRARSALKAEASWRMPLTRSCWKTGRLDWRWRQRGSRSSRGEGL